MRRFENNRKLTAIAAFLAALYAGGVPAAENAPDERKSAENKAETAKDYVKEKAAAAGKKVKKANSRKVTTTVNVPAAPRKRAAEQK